MCVQVRKRSHSIYHTSLFWLTFWPLDENFQPRDLYNSNVECTSNVRFFYDTTTSVFWIHTFQLLTCFHRNYDWNYYTLKGISWLIVHLTNGLVYWWVCISWISNGDFICANNSVWSNIWRAEFQNLLHPFLSKLSLDLNCVVLEYTFHAIIEICWKTTEFLLKMPLNIEFVSKTSYIHRSLVPKPLLSTITALTKLLANCMKDLYHVISFTWPQMCPCPNATSMRILKNQ